MRISQENHMNEIQKPRRSFLKLAGSVVAVIPLVAASTWADAATNPAMRTSLKYQDKPNGDQKCANCSQFVPGKDPKAKGGCKLIAGDDEIAPEGYCIAWMKKG
jgi:hypothetical protein